MLIKVVYITKNGIDYTNTPFRPVMIRFGRRCNTVMKDKNKLGKRKSKYFIDKYFNRDIETKKRIIKEMSEYFKRN